MNEDFVLTPLGDKSAFFGILGNIWGTMKYLPEIFIGKAKIPNTPPSKLGGTLVVLYRIIGFLFN